MRFHALATDYDETLAEHGRVSDATLASLEAVKASGRALVLVTGRQLPDLLSVFPRADLFDVVVAENGAILNLPGRRETRRLAEAPPKAFVDRLAARGVTPLSLGEAIVATREPWQGEVLEAIRDLGLELQVIFNKGAVMVLPSGVNKASGLVAGLAELGLSRHDVVGVGDGENDHVFLTACGLGAAVANALPMLRERADLVLSEPAGAGVREFCQALLGGDLARRAETLLRHAVVLGTDETGTAVTVPSHGAGLLFAGPSGAGKSTAAKGTIERLVDAGQQVLIVDPEGDYATFERTVCLGDATHAPSMDELLHALASPSAQIVANLVALPLADRPGYLAVLAPRLLELRARTGRPHWLVLDEAHHLAPASDQRLSLGDGELAELLLITVKPSAVAPGVLDRARAAVAVGSAAGETLADFCRVLGEAAPAADSVPALGRGEVIVFRRGERAAHRVRVAPTRAAHHRHRRKYAEGRLDADRSFWFRGPGQKLRLRASNLTQFAELADGVDDETWQFHLSTGDIARWFETEIKDEELARVARDAANLGPSESRRRIGEAIRARYTLPSV